MAKYQDSIRNFMDMCIASIPLKVEEKEEEKKKVEGKEKEKKKGPMKKEQKSGTLVIPIKQREGQKATLMPGSFQSSMSCYTLKRICLGLGLR